MDRSGRGARLVPVRGKPQGLSAVSPPAPPPPARTARAHLVAGSTGAGKTTYALALAGREGGVRFSIDAWMAALFWPDAPQPLDAAWAMARVERCSALIWETAAAVAARGVPVVLDLGFTTRAARARVADLALAAGLPVKLHWLDAPADLRWARVEARNAGAGVRELDFPISRAMFDYVETLWEPPDDAEMAALDGARLAA